MSMTSSMVKMMAKGGAKVKQKLEEASKNPREEQTSLLFALLDQMKDSEIGKKYDMESIKSVEEFQARLPLTDYDFFSPYIERMTKGEENLLTNQKIVHYNETSGTLGAPKKIPVTERHVKLFSGLNAKYLNYLASETLGYDWTKHKGLSLTEGTYRDLPNGISVGCASSLMAARMGKMIPFLKLDMMSSMYSSPIEARQPAQGTCARYIHARFALMDGSLSYANATFSSYLLEVMRYIEDNHERFVEEIRTGTISPDVTLPDEVRKSLLRKIKPMPKRADELARIFSEGFGGSATPLMKRLWPNMAFIICVGGAAFSVYTEKLKDRYCGREMPFIFLGVTASEGYFSAPIRMNDTSSMLVPNGVFMEFLPVDTPSARPLLIDELEMGGQYEIVITNLGGLFRYRMKDILRVTGFYNKTPLVEFVSRSGSAINMYGEKTSEKQLQSTVMETVKELGLDLYDYAFCPDSDFTPGKYVLLLELRNDLKNLDRAKLAEIAEKHLRRASPDMDEVLDAGICGHMSVKLLQPETFLFYRDLRIAKGASAAQLKPIHVLATPMQKKFFYILEEQELPAREETTIN